MLTPDHTTRIARAILCLRDKWTESMVRATLANPEIKRRDPRAVAIAFTACATDPETKHPNRLLETGPWWDLVKWASDDAPTYRYPNPRDCRLCAKPEAACTCGSDYEPAFVSVTAKASPEQIAAAKRAAIENAKPLPKIQPDTQEESA